MAKELVCNGKAEMGTQYEPTHSQPIELTNELDSSTCVSFDAETASFDGIYGDELSVFRARKIWKQTLESNFLLEEKSDFTLKIVTNLREGRFMLKCDFLTACGRYAFWRVTNHQAPEAQYIIETAHIPQSETHLDAFLHAPDMRDARREYLAQVDGGDIYTDDPPSLKELFSALLRRLKIR